MVLVLAIGMAQVIIMDHIMGVDLIIGADQDIGDLQHLAFQPIIGDQAGVWVVVGINRKEFPVLAGVPEYY